MFVQFTDTPGEPGRLHQLYLTFGLYTVLKGNALAANITHN